MPASSASAAAVPMFIGGTWSESDQPIEIRTPGGERRVGASFEATAEQLDHAIEAAVASQPQLAAQAPYQRSALLREVSGGMLDQLEQFARLLSEEAGKPIKDARTEVERTAMTFRIAAEEAERISGEVIDLGLNQVSRGRIGITRRFPAGPVAGISPFNLPLSLAAHKLAPAMAAGCPIVLKIPSQTPLALLKLARLIDASGALPGSVTMAPMSIRVGDRLVTDDRFKVLSFTGSPRVGWDMKARSGRKRVILELGGNAGALVDSSADLDWAARRCVQGAFKYAGQTCISVQRVYVHAQVWGEFTDRFVKLAAGLRVGDPAEESTDVGPLISPEAADRVRRWVAEAVAEGATVLLGGDGEGSYLPPTVLTDVPPAARVCREEAFGPVAVLSRIESFDEGIEAINDSVFGLQAGVFTADVANSWRAFERLEVGGVILNDSPTYRIDHMPYGGVKDSGLGREGVRYAIEDLTERRLFVIAQPQ
jgi:acyl-CoA reductase-like NAD-dependent aldehyde dehydrogenase